MNISATFTEVTYTPCRRHFGEIVLLKQHSNIYTHCGLHELILNTSLLYYINIKISCLNTSNVTQLTLANTGVRNDVTSDTYSINYCTFFRGAAFFILTPSGIRPRYATACRSNIKKILPKFRGFFVT